MMEDKKISVTVRTRPGVEQRARGGHNFGKEPKTVLVTAENLELIRADPRLNIIAESAAAPEEEEETEGAEETATPEEVEPAEAPTRPNHRDGRPRPKRK
jgi:hypothetical protein